ncbi:MAG: phytanoyl-CoA dioxygenase family protein [Actinomycetota bacterium]
MAEVSSATRTDAFWRDGYLFPTPVLDRQTALAHADRFEQLRIERDGTLPKPFADYARTNFHMVSTLAADLAHHPAILDAVEALLGPDLLVWMVELIVKQPHSDKILTMHQDLNYWGFDHADREVTAWLALSDVSVANGAMSFVRGSHRHGSVDHHDTYGENNLLTRGQEISVDYDPVDEVAVELSAGQLSLHHGLTFHGSGPNTTDGPRVALAIRYITPEMGKAGGSSDYAMLVRGADRHNRLIKVTRPESDFSDAGLAMHTEMDEAQLGALSDGATDDFGYTRGA